MAKKKQISAVTAELYQQVRELRESGLSFAAIGRELGFSKQYAHHIFHMPPPDPGAVQPVVSGSARPSTGLTLRERLFLRGLSEGKSQRQAALDAVPPGQITPESASQWAHNKLRNPRLLTAFLQLLERHGLTEEHLIKVHLNNLQATKVVATATENGKVTDLVERPDFRARQMAVRDGYQLWSRLQKHAPEEPPEPHPIITLTVKRAEWVAKVSKRPLEELVRNIEIVDPEDDDKPEEPEPPTAPDPAPEPFTPSTGGASPSTADDVEWEDVDDTTIEL